MTTQKAIDTAPRGTSGLIVTPWSPSEPYGVAANWAEASAPVYTLGEDGWTATYHQVADYCHEPLPALAAELEATIRACGEEPAEGEVEALAADAEEF